MQNIEMRLKPYLLEGEHFLWVGKPRVTLSIRQEDRAYLPISVLFAVMAIVALSSFLQSDEPVMTKMFISVALSTGLYLLSKRFFKDALSRSRTVYGITDHRVLAGTFWLKPAVESYYHKQPLRMDHYAGTGQWGTIVIWREDVPPLRLSNIEGVEEVYVLLKNLADKTPNML